MSLDLQKGVSGGCSDSLFHCTKYTETRGADPAGDQPDPKLHLKKRIRIWREQPVTDPTKETIVSLDPTEKPDPNPT